MCHDRHRRCLIDDYRRCRHTAKSLRSNCVQTVARLQSNCDRSAIYLPTNSQISQRLNCVLFLIETFYVHCSYFLIGLRFRPSAKAYKLLIIIKRLSILSRITVILSKDSLLNIINNCQCNRMLFNGNVSIKGLSFKVLEFRL